MGWFMAVWGSIGTCCEVQFDNPHCLSMYWNLAGLKKSGPTRFSMAGCEASCLEGIERGNCFGESIGEL